MELVISCWQCKGELRGDRTKPYVLAEQALKLGWELGDRDPKSNSDPCTAKICICPGCCDENAAIAEIHNENLAIANEKSTLIESTSIDHADYKHYEKRDIPRVHVYTRRNPPPWEQAKTVIAPDDEIGENSRGDCD